MAFCRVEMHIKKKDGELFLQEPPAGPFNHKALQWHLHTAYIPYHRVNDFICGEENRKGFPTKFIRCQKHENVRGNLKGRVDGETYLEKICYHCSYGPDLGARTKRGVSKEDSMDGDQRECPQGDPTQENDIEYKLKKRGIKKRGCLCNFEVGKLYLHPSVARLTYECFEHVNPEGVLCHGIIGSSSVTRPISVTTCMEKNQLEFREQSPKPEAVAAPVHTRTVVESNPGMSTQSKTYEEILRIESRLKSMLCDNPLLLIDYCSLLEELEEKLKKVLATKQSSAPILPPPVNNLSLRFGLNVKEALEESHAVRSIQYPPAPPMKFPSSGPGIDWVKVLASKQGPGPLPTPVPSPKDRSEPGYDWKKILGERQNVTSIYIPPAPPMKENPGGFDWEKALAESQNSLLSQHVPSISGNGSPGFGFGFKHILGRSKIPTAIEIPPAPPFKTNLLSGLSCKPILEANQRLVRKSAEGFEEHTLHGSTSKRVRIAMPSKTREECISHPFMEHSSLPRPTAFSPEKISLARSPSDVEELRDTSEDTSSV